MTVRSGKLLSKQQAELHELVFTLNCSGDYESALEVQQVLVASARLSDTLCEHGLDEVEVEIEC